MSGHIETDRGMANASESDLSHHPEHDQDDADGSSLTDISLIQHSESVGKGRLDSLRENLSKQQERLTALRERALRKSEDGGRRKPSISDSMESLKSLGQKLTILKGRTSSGRMPTLTFDQQLIQAPPLASTPLVTPTKDTDANLEISGSEKLQMLNQRTEQNRALLEQRKRDLAKSLQSVKSGLSRHSASGSELGSSMSDLHALAQAQMISSGTTTMSRHRSAADLQPQAHQQPSLEASDESRLKLLKNKMKLIELKQSRKEQELQQELIELRNELTKKEQLIQQLEGTVVEQSEEMAATQQLSLEQQENARMHTEIEQLRKRNAELETSSEILDATRFELHSAREELLEQRQLAIKVTATRNSTDAQVNVELAKRLQDLENQLDQLRSSQAEAATLVNQAEGTEAERLAQLEATIETQRNQLAAQTEQLAEKTTELNVLNVNLRVLEEKLAQTVKSKPIFLDENVDGSANEQLQTKMQQLKQKLDECNKSNIKLKLKCKQAEKQLQKLQSSDTQQQLAQLSAENEELQQRIIVLEDEKGQWQLAHVEEEEDDSNAAASKQQQESEASTLTARSSSLLGAQTETIRLLEEQKEELQQALEALQLGSESARVESELSEVQMEEQLSQRVQQLETEANEQRQQLQTLQTEKEALDKKLTHYINENMELLDKLEKLSSSSSAESIEIVERPTDRRFTQRPASEGDADADVDTTEPTALPSFVSELTQTDLAPVEQEVNESLLQLRIESDELHKKVELFTKERREVLAKMEHLQAANAELQSELNLAQKQLLTDTESLQTQLKHTQDQLQAETAALQSQLEELQRDKQHLSLQLSEKSSLSQELSSMQRSSEVVAALDCGEAGGAALFDKCERSLTKLSSELEAYRKASDRSAKLNVSKKLAKEAKNVHTQLTELLHKVKEASTAVETVTVVETVVAVTAPNGKALAEYEQLTAQNAELKSTLAALQIELNELRDSFEPIESTPKLAITSQEEQEQHEQQKQQLEQYQEELREQHEQHQRVLTKHQLELEELQQELQQLSGQRDQLQAERERLQFTITDLQAAEVEHLQLIGSQSAELVQLQLQAEQFDQQLNNTEMTQEKQMEQHQRMRRELESRIETLEGERSILQALVAEQKQQLIENYSESEHQSNLKLLELQQCQQKLATSEGRNKELREKLKKYALNLKKRTTDQAELEQQLRAAKATVDNQKEMLERLQAEQQDNRQQMHLEQQLQAEQATTQSLREQLQQLEQNRREGLEAEQRTVNRLKGELQTSLETNDQLQQQTLKQQKKLTTLVKAKEEVQRLQEELQNTVHTNTVLRKESYQLEQTLAAQTGAGDNSNRMIEDLRYQLEQRSLKLNKSKEVIKQRNASIQGLQRELNELRAKLQSQPEEEPQEERNQVLKQLHVAQEQNARLSEEKVNFELAIGRLETLHEGIQAKLLQDQSYIETLETENAQLQAKSAALEDQAAALQSQQSVSNDHIQLLEHQLRERSEQQLDHETQLATRLQQLTEHEQLQSRQLQQLTSESDETHEQLAALQAMHGALLARHKQQTEQALAEREQLSSHSEQELVELRSELEKRNQELQRQRNIYEAKLAAKATELDELECDLSAHMERATVETRDLTQQLERTQEQLQARGEELNRINEELADVERERSALSRETTLLRLQQDSAEQDVLELQELRMQAMQDKTEMDNLRSQIDSLCANHTQELQVLQQQIAELDTLGQNQTDDQVYIESENKRLAEQLTEMQARLVEQAEQLNRQQSVVPMASATTLFHSQHQAPPISTPASDDWMYSSGWQLPNQRPPPPGSISTEQALPIPPPSIFFGSDAAAAPSPFDEIVAPPLRISAQQAAPEPSSGVEATIEDLQRNVSDLEKHAKDLETKLLARNQALAEHEERRAQLERLLAEREQELAQMRAAAEERERVAAIEKLIQTEQSALLPAPAMTTTAIPTLDMFFGSDTVTDSAIGSLELGQAQTEPVVEELITPKKAYLCHPEQQQQEHAVRVSSEWGVDMDEDPWATAAAAAAERPAETAAMAELQARIVELERQKTELQTKTAKLMKRIKEYRSKEQQQQQQDQSKSTDSDLDGAIIEELKHQLQMQESRQFKTDELVQQNALEKEKLIKRIDVLTAGNERMAELKERQDMDVQMYQARIRELQEKLQQLESWGDDGAHTVKAVAAAPAAVEDAAALTRIENLQAENSDLNSECQELQAQLQLEKKQAQQALAEAQAQLQRAHAEAQQAQAELQQAHAQAQRAQTQLQTEAQQAQEAQAKLKQAQAEAQQAHAEKQRALEVIGQQSEQERRQLQADQHAAQEELLQLQLQLDELRSKQLELPASVSAPNDDSIALLQEKESEIVHLKQRIEELMREDQTEKLVFEILTKNQELHMLRLQVKQLEEHKLEEEEKEQQKQVVQSASTDNTAELEQLRQQCDQLQQEKNDMEEELRVLNNHVLSSLELEDKMKQSVLELDMKTIEITELRKSLEQLQQLQAQTQQPPPAPQADLSELNRQWEALVEQKCSEVATIWQEHLAQREAAHELQIDQFKKEVVALKAAIASAGMTTTVNPNMEQKLQEEDSDTLANMQKALEAQEMEIVTLKEQLAIRSAEYARLASQYDPFRLQNTLGATAVSGAVTGAGAAGTGSVAGQEPPEYVLKSDLDYALMMLHQRDMRVEEMILELVQLLEERDHLQLKLSDTLRQLETERSRSSDEATGHVAATSFTSVSSSSAGTSPNRINIAGSNSELTAASGSDLKQKLAELQTIKHSKDKAIVDEREQRLRQMSQLQRDMAKPAPTATIITTAGAAALPSLAPAAAASPQPASVGAAVVQTQQLDVDPSQQSLRSPSMLLMDWIMGTKDDAPNPPAPPASN